jgi:hypothetical protein
VAAGLGVLLAITAVVFVAFDKDSHSASDTLRPLLITMVPVWVIAVVAARYFTGGKR